jgi:hypothetical protein
MFFHRIKLIIAIILSKLSNRLFLRTIPNKTLNKKFVALNTQKFIIKNISGRKNQNIVFEFNFLMY